MIPVVAEWPWVVRLGIGDVGCESYEDAAETLASSGWLMTSDPYMWVQRTPNGQREARVVQGLV